MPGEILSMTGISKVFGGVIALDKVQFNLRAGEVHALIGENGAGKSTLMKVLLGLHKRDGGEIVFDGKTVTFADPAEALRSGVSMIHQEVNLVHQMSVSENIWLGRERLYMTMGLISTRKRDQATKELLRSLEIEIEPSARVNSLSIGQMQLVELARAVSHNPRIIIMDEPTSALTDQEVEKLYRIIRSLTAKGVAIVFISHKLEELYQICDRVTIMRDGHYVGCYNMSDITNEMMIKLITDRTVEQMFIKEKTPLGDTALEVRNLSRDHICSDINFTVRAGEVVGFCGLMGAGRSEILRAIFGVDKRTSGEILINGKKVTINCPSDAVACGMGMVTEDRLRQGAIYTMSVMQNATIAVFHKLCNRIGYNSPKKELKLFKEKANDLSVKYDSPNSRIGVLSGGNQQKVIIERWLLTNPSVLLLDEPTRGIDVGSKAEIYKLINRMSKEGRAVLMVSSEMPELLSLCDRIMVVREGRIVYETARENATQETLMNYAFGLYERKDREVS